MPLLNDNDPLVRATATRALAQVNPAKFLSDVLPDTKETYYPVLIARLYALAILIRQNPGDAAYQQAYLKLALELLHNREWQARARAIEALFQVRTADVIEPLIRRIPLEVGRLKADIIGVLETLTGQPIGENAAEWLNWWKQRKDGWVPYAGTLEASTPANATVSLPTFQGLKVRSKKAVFVIDMSGSMISQHPDRVKAAVKDLAATIMAMPADSEVSIVIMNSRTPKEGGRFWSRTLKPLNGGNKIDIQNFVARVLASLTVKGTGTGDFEPAMEDAMNIQGVDTIYVWSDGYPTGGKHITPAGVLDAIQRVNQYKSIRINSIITEDPERWVKDTENMMEEFMRQLAATNSGEYVKR